MAYDYCDVGVFQGVRGRDTTCQSICQPLGKQTFGGTDRNSPPSLAVI